MENNFYKGFFFGVKVAEYVHGVQDDSTERIISCLQGLASRDIAIENPPGETTAALPDGPEGERLKKVYRDFFAVRMDFHQEAAQWILAEWERLGGKNGDI